VHNHRFHRQLADVLDPRIRDVARASACSAETRLGGTGRDEFLVRRAITSFARLDKLKHVPQTAVFPTVGYALACPAGRRPGLSLWATKGDEVLTKAASTFQDPQVSVAFASSVPFSCAFSPCLCVSVVNSDFHAH
jgi:hypothetical protein